MVFSCPHGPTKHIFESFLAVRMALQNTFFFNGFGVLSGTFFREWYTKKAYLTPALDNSQTLGWSSYKVAEM